MAKRKLHPDFPVVVGTYQITKEWSCELPEEFNRRIEEDGDLVIWRPGLTFWVAVWNNDNNESREHRFAAIRASASQARTNEELSELSSATLLTYELAEGDGQHSGVTSLYAFALSDNSQVEFAAYADSERDLHVAKEVAASLTCIE